MTTNQTIDGVPRELSEAVSTIIRDICEHEPDDNPDSAHISIKALELILLQNLEGRAAPVAQHQGEPSREALNELWNDRHFGHPADFAEEVLERWGKSKPQGEPVAFAARDALDDPQCVGMHATKKPNELQCVALYAKQPAPVAVVLPEGWQDQLLDEMTTRFELNKHDDDHMVYDDTQIGVEFARDWITKRLNSKS